MSEKPLAWITAGRRFGFEDLVFWSSKGNELFSDVAPRIDTIIFGPHASAAFPAELKPFVAIELTARKQFDFSDVTTSAIGRAWATVDPHAVYVENPHSRVVLDPNRAPVDDIEPGLRRFFTLYWHKRLGEVVDYRGVDNVRPITFSDEFVIREPKNDQEWTELIAILKECGEKGPKTYLRIRDELVEHVLSAKPKGSRVLLISLHDTMNTQMQPDGAIIRERSQSVRLPWLVNLGNLGDTRGEGPADELSISSSEIHRISDAFAKAWEVRGEERDAAISLNSPYKGAYETIQWGSRLRRMRNVSGGMIQAEFLRETLLGPSVASSLGVPGDNWPEVDALHIAGIASRLKRVGDILRMT